MIQSFDHETLKYFEVVNQDFVKAQTDKLETTSFKSQSSVFTQHPLSVATLYLHNFYHTWPHSPTDQMVSCQGVGGHL